MLEEKKDEFVRMLRLYLIGMVDAKIVKSSLNCLFVDIILDQLPEETVKKLGTTGVSNNFNQLLKDMV